MDDKLIYILNIAVYIDWRLTSIECRHKKSKGSTEEGTLCGNLKSGFQWVQCQLDLASNKRR